MDRKKDPVILCDGVRKQLAGLVGQPVDAPRWSKCSSECHLACLQPRPSGPYTAGGVPEGNWMCMVCQSLLKETVEETPKNETLDIIVPPIKNTVSGKARKTKRLGTGAQQKPISSTIVRTTKAEVSTADKQSNEKHLGDDPDALASPRYPPIGKKIEVRWPAERSWFRGTVEQVL